MTRKLARYSLVLGTAGLLLSLFGTAILPQTAQALSGSQFQAGRIIDDSIFYNPNTMTIRQIQDFLTAKVPVCDTNGTQMYGNITRAQYGTSNGNPPPYTCLKDFRQTTTAKPAEAGLCNGYGVADHSAADIIYTVAQSCGINPKVLLVLLQKEQALITDDWPWPTQYRSATGYGCPDTAACDSQYYGFFNQVYSAARGFKYYAKYASSFNYLAGRNNFVRYNPDSNCGGTTLFIQNQATAGLYNYTPYQPNAAALNNLYGTGDNCSAYGNRNFWRLFNDWFGSTSDNIPISYNVRLTSAITVSPTNPAGGNPVTVTYTIKNFDPNNSTTLESSILQCRLLPSTNCDPAYNAPITLAANEQRTFTQTLTTMQTGGQYMLTPYFLSGGTWYRYGSDIAGGNMLQVNVPGMRLVTPITISPVNPVAGDIVTVSYTVKNFGITPVDYQSAITQCRFNTSTNCDPAYHAPTTIAPNEQRTFAITLPQMQGGNYVLTPYYMTNNTWYTYGLWGVGSNTLSLSVPDVRLTTPISTAPSAPIPGQPTTVTYTVQNFGSQAVPFDSSILQCRFNTYTNCDPAYDAPATLNAGAQRTFTVNLPAVRAGSYNLTPYFLSNGRWYNFAKGTAPATSIRVDVPEYVADMQMVGGITTNPVAPIPGQPVTVTYTMRNAGSKPAIFQTSILQCRFNTYTNCDPAYDAPLTINAGDQRTFTVNFPAVKAGTYLFVPYYAQNDKFYRPPVDSTNHLFVSVPAYVADVRLTGPITSSPAQPAAGQTFTVSYTVKNFGTQPGIFQSSILQCRRNISVNCDSSYDSPYTINAGAEQTFTRTFTSPPSGSYNFVPYFLQNDTWYRYNNGVAPANTLQLNL